MAIGFRLMLVAISICNLDHIEPAGPANAFVVMCCLTQGAKQIAVPRFRRA